MSNFEYKSFFEQKKMNQEELNQYYRALRKYEYEIDAPIKGIQLRKKIYCLVNFVLKMDRIFSGRTMKILDDKRIKTEKPKIYACTHIGRYDIESAIEAIGEATWFIMGDPGKTYTNIDGVLLRLYMSEEEELFILTHNLASAIKEAKSLFNIKLLQDIEERQLKD